MAETTDTPAAAPPAATLAATPAPVPGEAELKTFILTEHEVRTVSGEVWKCKAVSLGKEKLITHLLKDLMATLFKTQIIQKGGLDVTDDIALAGTMDLLFDMGPDKLSAAAAILLDKKKEEIDEHLDLETAGNLVVPFLYSRREALARMLRPYFAGLVQSAQAA